jgi:hypothetical protein
MRLEDWTGLAVVLDPKEGELAVEPESVGSITKVIALEGATSTGRVGVAVVVRLPDGREVVGATTLRLFSGAAAAFRGRFGDDGGAS